VEKHVENLVKCGKLGLNMENFLLVLEKTHNDIKIINTWLD
jgi:hypothetical protein